MSTAATGPTPVLTLRQVRERTGISMPTLYRYKKDYAGRIPAIGKGRSQRFPLQAVAVFAQIKRENLAKRGRYERTASDRISLAEVARRTRIAYPTLLQYVRKHLPELPHEGAGYKRRFLPGAVAVFERLRGEARPGRPPGKGSGSGTTKADLLQRLIRIEEAQAQLIQEVRALGDAIGSVEGSTTFLASTAQLDSAPQQGLVDLTG